MSGCTLPLKPQNQSRLLLRHRSCSAGVRLPASVPRLVVCRVRDVWGREPRCAQSALALVTLHEGGEREIQAGGSLQSPA